MQKYTINHFSKGDKVYHLSNTRLIMVVIKIRIELIEISCRWVDNSGNVQCVEFMPEELGKSSDLRSLVTYI